MLIVKQLTHKMIKGSYKVMVLPDDKKDDDDERDLQRGFERGFTKFFHYIYQ